MEYCDKSNYWSTDPDKYYESDWVGHLKLRSLINPVKDNRGAKKFTAKKATRCQKPGYGV